MPQSQKLLIIKVSQILQFHHHRRHHDLDFGYLLPNLYDAFVATAGAIVCKLIQVNFRVVDRYSVNVKTRTLDS